MSSENDESIKEQYGVKKRVSVVWNYFEKLNRYRVRCKLCLHEQNYQGTTGNILRHLKNKHNIDATLKGQSENPELLQVADTVTVRTTADMTEQLAREDEFDVIVKTEHNEVNILTLPRQIRQSRSKVSTYAEEPDPEPYAEVQAVELTEYLEPQVGNVPKRKLSKLAETNNVTSHQNGDGETRLREKQKSTILEDRLIAEIEYFREKAAYYRMQKNLTSLQARKIRYELDQMG